VAQASGLIILISAVGTVVFLFAIDHYYRIREKRAEEALEQIKEQAHRQAYIEIKEEGDEPNIAA